MPPPPPPPPPPMPPGRVGPPQPPPMPGHSAGGPPPPPPMPSTTRPPNNVAKDRGALLGDIERGRKLKKAVTNDRSAPIVGQTNNSAPGPPVGGAPPIPGLRAPDTSRARANSDIPTASTAPAAPQLGGILAGGIPKLRKTTGGVATGASGGSEYQSDTETQRSSSAPRLPITTVPAPPSVPPGPPPVPGAISPSPATSILMNNLRPTPVSMHSSPTTTPPRPKPGPPIAKKPPIPPPTLRKPSVQNSAPTTPPVPVPAPSTTTSLPASAPRPPTSRSSAPQPPPGPPVTSTNGDSLAALAARNAAFGRTSPGLAPPPPPAAPSPPPPQVAAPSNPPPPPMTAPKAPTAPPPPPLSPPSGIPTRRKEATPMSAAVDSSAYTLTNGTGLRSYGGTSPGGTIAVHDPRWKFQDDSQLPKPRDVSGITKRYRAGRVSTVPLNLSSLE